ncbi:MAG: RluA family pseudouridine synthase [Pseudomonadota bacterium]
MVQKTLTFLIGPNPPARLDKALARDVPADAALSRSRLARLLADGAVRLDGVVIRDAKARVAESAEIAIDLPALKEAEAGPEDIALDIVFEDDDLLVVNKSVGMAVHPAPGTPGGTLVNALLFHAGARLSGIGGVQRPGIVHRIDKDTSGLLVVAKNDAAHHGLAAQFEAHSAERRYLALVFGVPEAASPRLRGLKGVSFEAGDTMKITSRLARHRTDRQRQAVFFNDHGRHAVTRARRLAQYGQPPAISLLECRLETGRTHQIRVHLAHTGHGLIGDPVYGGRRKISARAFDEAGHSAISAFGRQALHAASLGFRHPASGHEMQFEAPMPADMAALIAALEI